MDRQVCIHGHFYQPPRENPWLEAVEHQESAYPYHDWNERITAECYAPNATSRIFDAEGRIEQVVNNYSRISFNFGPTLLSWLGANDPQLYEGIIDADRAGRDAFSGHGPALAQGYNHLILPLASSRDKATQVRWGARDFEHRFGRRPEGMWLPETAVDLETLDLLAAEGIAFTVLAPRQAQAVRRREGRNWRDVSGGRIDPTMPYLCELPSGRTIVLFFYDGPISQAVAFEGLLSNGEHFANRLLSGFSGARTRREQLLHIATDGESYGHHHKHGEMALSYALHHLESNGLAEVTNYGLFLERFPPTHLVRIFENSSWSCVHGIERWRADCGCNSGGRPGWNQQWRAPLRAALDLLRDAVAGPFERRAGELFADPWAARDGFVDVVLDRSPAVVDRFLEQHGRGALDEAGRTAALELMELQRHAMLMYTSCGWFFDEVSGLETTQVLQYAGRVVQLARRLFGETDIAEPFLAKLAEAKSNLPEQSDGRSCYERFVVPAVVDLEKVGAHYAISSLFESYDEEAAIHCYRVTREDYRQLSAGKARLAVGRARIVSSVTLEAETVSFGVLHLGDHNVSGGVRRYQGEAAYGALVEEITGVFRGADMAELIRAVDRNFGTGIYSLRYLFRDEQERILGMILGKTLADMEASFLKLYEQHAPLMRFLTEMRQSLPRPFREAAETAINSGLRQVFENGEIDRERVMGLLSEAETAGVTLDESGLAFAARRAVHRIARRWREDPLAIRELNALRTAVETVRALPFEVVYWEPQNIFFELARGVLPGVLQRRAEGDEEAGRWINVFTDLGGKLGMRPPEGLGA